MFMIGNNIKVLFLSLFLLVLTACSNKNTPTCNEKIIVSLFNDFETETLDSVWINVNRFYDKSSISGDFSCECPENQNFALTLNHMFNDSILNYNAFLNFNMKIRSESKPDAVFVVNIKKDNKDLFWNSYPLSNGFEKENQWYDNSIKINVPFDVLEGSKLNCYVLNNNKNHFYIDDFKLDIEYYKLATYLDKIKNYDIPDNLINVSQSDNINILYSDDDKKLLLADSDSQMITKPLSMFYSIIINQDTLNMQFSEWDFIQNDEAYIFKSGNELLDTEIKVSLENDNPNAVFSVKSTYHKQLNVLRSSLILPFKDNDFIVYRKNPFVDTVDYQDVYYLDKEGFSLNVGDKQLNLYHPDELSSIQLDVRNSTAYLNTDFYYDHLLIRFELADTTDCYVDNSATLMKESSVKSSSFVLSLTDKTALSRIMPVFDGYESAFIWTEHADWSDIRTHRATYFGSEEVENIDEAVGGFAAYDIPVTKSVFYHNPDSVLNVDKNPDYKGMHSTVMTDSLFLDFLEQLRDNDFDICLHTPEQYTSTKEYLDEALSFMKDNFASPSWIDHGYNNAFENNRENMVCDGLDSLSPYYIYELWKQNGVKYPWNAALEDMRPFEDYLFDNHMLRPYPGFGDALPLPKVSSLYSYPDILLWSTPCTVEPGPDWAWDYYFNQERLDAIVKYRYVYITHIYAPWVEEDRGFWEMRDGKVMAKEGFNRALQKLSDMRKQHLLLPTTIDDYMAYQRQLQSLTYRMDKEGNVVLKNNNDETIKGLSLISTERMSLADDKKYDIRKSTLTDEFIIWFDILPYEEVRIVKNSK